MHSRVDGINILKLDEGVETEIRAYMRRGGGEGRGGRVYSVHGV